MSWVKTSERMPETSESVLVWFPEPPPYKGGRAIVCWHALRTYASEPQHNWSCEHFSCEIGQGTHWMPLPEPPK